jgi:hypothetical protein
VQGLVGRDLTLEEAYNAARLTALSMLASLKRELGNLDRVTRWIRAVGYVHCEPGFGQNAAVVNGFSDLIVELWGDAGRHARSAPGQGADRDYDSPLHRQALRALGIRPIIAKRRTKHGSGPGSKRWVVERTLSWLHQYRRLRSRYERRADIPEAFLSLACSLICLRRLNDSFC